MEHTQGDSLETQISNIIEAPINSMGFSLVRVKIMDGSRGQTLQIMAERNGEDSMTVDDCTSISRTVSALMDVEDPIKGEYNLEISSPGIDRPLTRLQDFDRFSGNPVKIMLKEALDGRKKYRGLLAGVQNNDVIIALNGDVKTGDATVTTKSIAFDKIAAANLTISEQL